MARRMGREETRVSLPYFRECEKEATLNVDELRKSVARSSAPDDHLPPLVQALWWDAKGDWEMAHRIAQDVDSKDGAWVHAYLHRKEGDPGNARYWYRMAERPFFDGDLDAEWNIIADELLR